MDSFVASHLATPGTTITHTRHFPSTQTLSIPEEDLDDFYRIYAASIPDHSITEKITATPHFPFFLDVDMKFKHVQENWASADEVIMFFHDLFSEVSGMLEELFEMGAVEMVVTCRIPYKWHVYFTNVIVDKQTAIALVKRITADRDGLFADIIDDKVYSAGLRMLGSHKGGMRRDNAGKPDGYDDAFPDHPWSEYYRVATIDDTTLQIENDVTEAQVRKVALTTYKDRPLTPLTPQGKQELGAKRVRFTRDGKDGHESTHNGNNVYNNDMDDASAQAIQDYLRQALAQIDPSIDPTVCAMKRYENTGMIQTTLVPQRCVFAERSHTRTLERNSPTLWVLFQTTQAFLRCFACVGQYTPLALPYPEEIKMLFASEETELDVMGVVDFPTHEKVANVIVHLLKHRYAASNSAGTVSSNRGLQFFVFVKEDHRWTAGYDMLVMEIMEEKGAIQTLISDFVTRTVDTLEEDEDKKERRSSWGKLRNQLQSNSYVCNNIMPIVGRKLAWFHTVKGVPFANRLDENRDLLGFTNGVYNIRSGGFRPGVPEDMVSMTAELAYHDLDEFPAETVQSVTSFLQRVFPVREECAYILQQLGMALSGRCIEQKFIILNGLGANGKSTLTKLINLAFGDYMGEADVSILTTKRPQSSQARPDLVSLRGRRIIMTAEPECSSSLKMEVVKQYTGGDKITARQLYGTQMSFYLQGTWFMMCNDIPTIASSGVDDYGTWRRIVIFPFRSKFVYGTPEQHHVDEWGQQTADGEYLWPVDPTVDQKLESWKECFASLLLDHAGRQRVPEPKSLEAARADVRAKTDVFSLFVKDKLIAVGAGAGIVAIQALFDAFRIWLSNANLPVGKKVSREMFERYMRKILGTPKETADGLSGWQVEIRPDASESGRGSGRCI
ncbi:hypothetical protein HK102_006208 [Quaeritorhiza haematococci]|nr:hypothetical protein HK102_006208 [Quaeritorhiza haematococci]